jgi:hypothetical protein
MRHINSAKGFINPGSWHSIRMSANISRSVWRESGAPENNSLRTDRGMSNIVKNLRGGTTIAWPGIRMTSGTYSDNKNPVAPRHIRDTLVQVFVSKRDVAGLLTDVDRYQVLHDRMHRPGLRLA